MVVGRRLPKRSIHNVCEHFSVKQSVKYRRFLPYNLLLEVVRFGDLSQNEKAEHT